MKDILVSVIVTTYNEGHDVLERTLNSVIAQTYEKIEIIVVDDGSKIPFSGIDRRSDLNQYNIKWISNGENKGVAVARNTGFKYANGEYLSFLDAGDWWAKEKISAQIKRIDKAGVKCGIVFSGAIVHKLKKKIYSPVENSKSFYRDLLVKQPIRGGISSAIIRRIAFEKVNGFYEKEDIPEDRDIFLRIAKIYTIIPDESFLVNIAVDPGSRSSDPLKKEITYKKFLKLHEKAIRKEGLWHKALAHYHVVIAMKMFNSKLYFHSANHFFQAFFIDPKFVLRGVSKYIFRRFNCKV